MVRYTNSSSLERETTTTTVSATLQYGVIVLIPM
jgi:hypothetical protein